ncbi:SDR family NAD(P)-dependent oxidoreductase [Micromonosporaceae bacterium Da 78-11]
MVTGGSGGIGLRLCRSLVHSGISVLVHAPDPAEAHAAAARLIGDGADPALVHPVAADFRRLSDVFSLARHLRHQYDGLDLLINSAGALAAPGLTRDGIDATFQINYVAPYVLTRMLAPALNTTGGRVVTLTSTLHRNACIDPDHPGADVVRPRDAYARAQLALLLFTRVLARTSQQRVTAVAVHPGCIDTGSFSSVHGAGGLPATDGALHVLHAADPATAVVNGGYYEGFLRAEAGSAACDDQAAVRLWLSTAGLVGWDYTAARLPVPGPLSPGEGRSASFGAGRLAG